MPVRPRHSSAAPARNCPTGSPFEMRPPTGIELGRAPAANLAQMNKLRVQGGRAGEKSRAAGKLLAARRRSIAPPPPPQRSCNAIISSRTLPQQSPNRLITEFYSELCYKVSAVRKIPPTPRSDFLRTIQDCLLDRAHLSGGKSAPTMI